MRVLSVLALGAALSKVERHIVRWTMPTAAEGQAALVFKVQVPCSELRALPVPTDKKKVFWVSGVPPEATVRYLFYLTGACADDPAPQDTENRRKLFSLKFRSERWMVALLDVTSLSNTDLLAARKAVIEQFLPNALPLELKEMRASMVSQPNEPLSDCHGLIEMCLTESKPFARADLRRLAAMHAIRYYRHPCLSEASSAKTRKPYSRASV